MGITDKDRLSNSEHQSCRDECARRMSANECLQCGGALRSDNSGMIHGKCNGTDFTGYPTRH